MNVAPQASSIPAGLGYLLKFQHRWAMDKSPLKIVEKSRQTGFTSSTAHSLVCRCAMHDARLDGFVSSRDLVQARLFLEDCRRWMTVLGLVDRCFDQGQIDLGGHTSAYVLQFANRRRIYSLSSNPNALAGKRGHVVLDEFALHRDQRLLYQVAKPVTTWGGQLEIISTHRGANTVFNQILREIKEQGNPMGWSHHKVTLQEAVDQGLAERINARTGAAESREAFLARLRRECIDQEQWLQEYCCVAADETTAFITYDMLTPCEDDCLKDFEYLRACPNPLFLGMDTGRKKDLTVIDVGELIGDVLWDRLRIELAGKTFSEQESELFQLLALPQLKRACLDATGLGMQLAERARQRFAWKVEAVTFTAPIKEELAFALRAAFEDQRLRIDGAPVLRADLRGIKKEITSSGNIRFAGESGDSHCDRFWAKALRQHALRHRREAGAAVA